MRAQIKLRGPKIIGGTNYPAGTVIAEAETIVGVSIDKLQLQLDANNAVLEAVFDEPVAEEPKPKGVGGKGKDDSKSGDDADRGKDAGKQPDGGKGK